MLIDELRMAIASKKDTEIIEPSDDALQFHSVYQEDSKGGFVFPNVI